jgi:hypothetical protein
MSQQIIGKGYVRFIEIEKPVLGNNIADAQRLEKSLEKVLDGQKIKIPWFLLKTLPTTLRAWDYKARAVLFKDRQSWRLVNLIKPDLIKPDLIKPDSIESVLIGPDLKSLECPRISFLWQVRATQP